MILAVDIGNTRIKAAVFEHSSLVADFSSGPHELGKKISAALDQFPKIEDIVVASVADDIKEVLTQLKIGVRIHYIDPAFRFPFNNQYQTPSSLGIDRMVLAAGAVLTYPKQNRLVIDAGTCVTYDFIDALDVYHGGAISPGIRLRYEALHNFTARLPLLKASEPENYIGNSTASSIHSGVINGIVNEIDGFIDLYRADYPNFIIILTGGDGDFLANRLKNTIFANSIFLLESLNQTFLYQSNK